ncbi:hypothetical protein Rs2_47800 [Raphanus sativus]|nr:hypothetical protein Rs2_47800 [Raphanus sativus]
MRGEERLVSILKVEEVTLQFHRQKTTAESIYSPFYTEDLTSRPNNTNPSIRPSPPPPQQQQQQSFAVDPAIAAVGPTVNSFTPSNWPSNGTPPPWPHASSSPPNFSPNLLGFPQFQQNPFTSNQFDGNQRESAEDAAYRLGFNGAVNHHSIQQSPPQRLVFGSFSGDATQSLNGGGGGFLNGSLNSSKDPNFPRLGSMGEGTGVPLVITAGVVPSLLLLLLLLDSLVVNEDLIEIWEVGMVIEG